MFYIKKFDSPLGMLTLGSDEDSLIGIWFDGQKYDRSRLKEGNYIEKDTEVLIETAKWLDIYFQGKDPGFTPKIKFTGTPFNTLIGQIMLTIPFGETMTYGEIAKIAAKKLGKEKMSAQAVGGAVGHNAISIIVPCHRVVGTNGSLTGYGGGMPRKVALLEIEGINLKERGFTIPTKGTAL